MMMTEVIVHERNGIKGKEEKKSSRYDVGKRRSEVKAMTIDHILRPLPSIDLSVA